ncbi:hypothetical protein ACI2KH_24400 [Roseomonas mucosa]|uniref:hypothetical protein n=1 Tax=Roseomonas mucosa TaxID=207340 RepID=UPI00384BA062
MPATSSHDRHAHALTMASSLASARRWQSEACALRHHAALPRLTAAQRAQLLREAEAADRQARFWLAGLPVSPPSDRRG